jgi:formylglycine-generating enzyme required for sulfatase activity
MLFRSRLLLPLVLAALLPAAAPAATAEKRLALVIGNGKYPSAPLSNPANDAEDMAAVLEKLGFEVILRRDAGRQAMEGAVQAFYRKLQGSRGIGLFYYAGHGLQVQGQNYLVPVDAEIESEGDVSYRAIDAGWVLRKMEDAANPVNIVILDACRNNPFTRGFRSAEKGLAQMPSPTGSIISYATAPGSVAADGQGRNGLYTRHLLRRLGSRGLSIEEVFAQVRQDVWNESGKKQTPWTSTSLMGRVSLAADAMTVVTEPAPPPAGEAEIAVLQPVAGPASAGRSGNSLGMEFAWIAPGSFLMGQSQAERQELLRTKGQAGYDQYYQRETQHHVTLTRGFFLQTGEVTVGQWRSFARATGYRTEAERDGGVYLWSNGGWQKRAGLFWEAPGFIQDDRHPVTCVSWNDAQEFIGWVNGSQGGVHRLPTEAEWEYACRAGSGTARYWGDSPDEACLYANVADLRAKSANPEWTVHPCDDGFHQTAPVARYRANRLGLFDMLGNAYEWCSDWYGGYPSAPVTDPGGPSGGAQRVARGGSWSAEPASARSAYRFAFAPDYRFDFLGFRLARNEWPSDGALNPWPKTLSARQPRHWPGGRTVTGATAAA